MPSLLDLTIGAAEIGVLLSSVLYGVATVQAYSYMERNFKDSIYIRGLVLVIWVIETIHTIFSYVLVYNLTVTHFGDPTEITRSPWSLSLTIPLSSFIGASVQIFFAWRVRKLGGQLIILIIAWIGAIVRLAIGIAIAVFLERLETIPEFLERYQWMVDALLSLNVAVDGLITVSLCYFLIGRRSDFQGSRRVIDKLIIYALETGLLTSLCAVGVLACSRAMPGNLVFLGVFLVYSKLFSNSLYASLNARQNLRQNEGAHVWSGQGGTGVYVDTQLSDLAGRSIALESGLKTVHPSQTSQSSGFLHGVGKKVEALA